MENTINIQPIDVSNVDREEKHAMAVYENANKLSIVTEPEYLATAELLKEIKSKIKTLDTARKDLTQPLEKVKKNLIALFNKPIDFLVKAENILKRQIIGYQQEQERIRQKEQARLDEITRKAEAKEKERLEKKALKQESKGNDAEAEIIREQAEAVVAPQVVVQREAPKVAGISTKTIWKYKVIDPTLIPREYLIVNEKAVGQVITATKGAMKIPGIEAYPETVIAAGSR